ncbi:hypothetical protein VUR80DRAFT_4688 [Thermomyces stellatus]
MKLLPLLSSPALAALQYVGADWSSVLVEEAAGISYQDPSGTTLPLESILAASGVDTVRQRIWVNPPDGNYDLEYNLELARRADAAGLRVYLDFHYSDSWADPGKQYAPEGWPTELAALEETLYEYTLSVCNAFADEGIVPNIISIGNEIRSGLLWPVGTTDNFGNIAALLGAASRAVRESRLGAEPKIMIHLDNGWDWGAQEWWYDSVLAAGLSRDAFDQMGVSYYPFYGADATLASLASSLENMAAKYGREIVVAEINWPRECSSPAHPFPADLQGIPLSWEGQVEFVKAVAEVVEGVDGGAGIFYWEPAWLNNAGLGSSCEANTMFEWPGLGLPSLNVFGEV